MSGTPARRGRPPRVRPETILDTVGAKEGEDWTMASIAAELGVSEPTVYYYFPSRKDLIEALAGRTFGSLPWPADGADWAQWLTDFATGLLQLYRRYPVLRGYEISTMATEQVGSVQVVERALRFLAGHGFATRDAALAMAMVLTIVQQCGRAEADNGAANGGITERGERMVAIAEKADAPLAAQAYGDPELWDTDLMLRRMLRVALAGIAAELLPDPEPGAEKR